MFHQQDKIKSIKTTISDEKLLRTLCIHMQNNIYV